MERQKTQETQNNPEKNARGITIPDSKLYYRTIIIIIKKQ